MKVTDLRPGNFEKACGFFSLFIFLTILLGGKYSSMSKHELPFTPWNYIQLAIAIKVVHEQSRKVEYEHERMLGTALKIH